MRGRKVGIVALARKLAIPCGLCRARGGAGGRHAEGLMRTISFLSLPHLR